MIRIRTLDVASIDTDAAGTTLARFAPRRAFDFQAGQHGLFVLPGGGAKPFTFSSAPGDELLAIATSVASGSRYKKTLAALTPGTTVRVVGPLGRFTLDRADRELVLVAQQIGITPFLSMLSDVDGPAGPGGSATTTLIHVGVEHPFRDRTAGSVDRALYPGDRAELGRAVQDAAEDQPAATFLLSGASAFVQATARQLVERGVPRSRIRRDRFYGDAGTGAGEQRPHLTSRPATLRSAS